jgi:hypothetical protein
VTALVQRKLPGTPIPREQLIAEWEDLRRRNNLRGPVASFLFDLHYSSRRRPTSGESNSTAAACAMQ